MGAVITLLAVVTLSLLITRIATVALVLTGVSKDMARFQARSAFTGSGFTTTESEAMMRHPVRRRIVMILMFAGSVGFVTILASGVTGFVVVEPRDLTAFTQPVAIELQDSTGHVLEGVIRPIATSEDIAAEPDDWYSWFFGFTPNEVIRTRILVLALGLIILYAVSTSVWVDQFMFSVVGWAARRFTSLDTHDYEGLLHIGEGYAVADLVAHEDDWITGKCLAQLRLSDEGVQVLGIQRTDGTFIGAPRGDTFIRLGDRVSIWGATDHLRELDRRNATVEGQKQHDERVHALRELTLQEGDQRAQE